MVFPERREGERKKERGEREVGGEGRREGGREEGKEGGRERGREGGREGRECIKPRF